MTWIASNPECCYVPMPWADLDVAIKGAREDGALVSRLANGIR